MRKSTLTTTLSALVVAICIQSAGAFSPIWNVNGWSKDRLTKAGIVVRPWRHEFQSENPPLPWIQVTFDCKNVPKDQPVVMTAWFRSNGKTITAIRAENKTAVDGKISLIFCLMPEQLDSSTLDIYIWAPTPDGHAAIGYQLSLKKLAELAREQPDEKPAEMQK